MGLKIKESAIIPLKLFAFTIYIIVYFYISNLQYISKFFSEEGISQSTLVNFFLLIGSYPITILFFGFLISNFKKISYYKTISFLLILMNLFCFVFMCLIALYGYNILWYAIFVLPIYCIISVVILIFGLVSDIKLFYNNHK